MRSGQLPPIGELCRLGRDDFQSAIGPLFEGAPRFVARLADSRPYGSYGELLDHGQEIAAGMPEDEQLELIDSHPRIGARPTAVSTLSFREQGYDREERTAELQQRLDALNDAYERRFGFRFVVFVAGRSRAEIADVIGKHLDGQRDVERRRALADVFAIARDRLSSLLPDEEGA